jgi:hemerythrin-like domain-containing protein
MRRVTFSLAVLGAGLGLTLLAQERRPAYEQGRIGPASRQLMDEHEVILKVVNAMQAEADHMRRGSSVDESHVRQMLDFSRNFTDRYHYAQEERYYFPAVLVYTGQRTRGLIDELEAEHAYARTIVDEVDSLLTGNNPKAAALIAERLSRYADVLRRHIRKENEQLCQKANAFLPEAEERALTIGFEQPGNMVLGSGFREHYYRMAEELSRAHGRLLDAPPRLRSPHNLHRSTSPDGSPGLQ